MRLHPPERIAEYVAAGWWSDDPARSWDELLRARAAERPGATAVVDPANREALLEALIGAVPGIAEVAVVGTPDDVLGERVTAVVVPAAGSELPTLGTIVAALREQRIASYELPEHLRVVEALPRNAPGKVLERELRSAPT